MDELSGLKTTPFHENFSLATHVLAVSMAFLKGLDIENKKLLRSFNRQALDLVGYKENLDGLSGEVDKLRKKTSS
ncbi:unnamed protein product [Ilex paraguariensis]|uniref:Uncharacterized protein n=1 Tax=Ilex paraguariensis TaxID=185542 RepID=A0ABC8R0A6_9AQUA